MDGHNVLIMTHDDASRNLLEQVFLIRDVQVVVVAATVQRAEAIIERWGLASFGLVIIDTAALGACDAEQKHVACCIVEDWTAKAPTLPFLVLGTFLQKHEMHTIRADRVRFLVKPFRLDDLVDAVDNLYLGKRRLNASLHHNP